MRGWPREFEESVKGFDCSREKGTRVVKMRWKWHKNDKMASRAVVRGWHTDGHGEGGPRDIWKKDWETESDKKKKRIESK